MMPLSSVNKGWVKKVPCMGFNKKASYNRRSDDYAKKPKLNKKTFAEKKSYNRAYDTAKPSVKQRFNVATEERKSMPNNYKSKPATETSWKSATDLKNAMFDDTDPFAIEEPELLVSEPRTQPRHLGHSDFASKRWNAAENAQAEPQWSKFK